MLFNSYEFIFLYLPIVAVGFFWIANSGQRLAALWLALASLFFYAWWNPQYVLLLVGSIIFNYAMGYRIGHMGSHVRPGAKHWLIAAIVSNLLLLGYFKYTDFFIGTLNGVAGTHWPLLNILLPLGISFFTFTQISFLVDVYRGVAREYDFVHYLLFVTYFPHLIAGPVLHHKQMMPQFELAETYRPRLHNINIGLTIFVIGLFKKVVLADHFAVYADPVFGHTAAGETPQFFEAWVGALAYTLQLYFDFSGYSDMAIGLSKVFNVNLPINFDSPYQSRNIIDFWRKWHMTLSAFLRDYVYITLGGNRYGVARRYVNLMATMLIGGLWHGANWTFVAWGLLHGIYLTLNHAWRTFSQRYGLEWVFSASPVSMGLTFLSVVFAWVLFRAEDFSTAKNLMSGMIGLNGVSLPGAMEGYLAGLGSVGVDFNGLMQMTNLPLPSAISWLVLGLSVVWFSPNSMQIADMVERSGRSMRYGVIAGITLMLVIVSFKKTSPFIYFQF